MDFYTLFSQIKNKTNYIIDIGASGGSEGDPVFQFICNKELKGLCIEPRTQLIDSLRDRIAPSFLIHTGFATPLNVIDIFQMYDVPESPDILKIDIDGYDLEVLRAILTKYKPKIIIAEINEKIPPPIRFEVKFKESYLWDNSHFYGFSIASGEKVMNQYGYKILRIFDLCNIVCVSDEFHDSLSFRTIHEIYRDDYIENPLRTSSMPWNKNVDYWLTLEDPSLLKEQIRIYFEYINDRSLFEIKTKTKDTDFLLEY